MPTISFQIAGTFRFHPDGGGEPIDVGRLDVPMTATFDLPEPEKTDPKAPHRDYSLEAGRFDKLRQSLPGGERITNRDQMGWLWPEGTSAWVGLADGAEIVYANGDGGWRTSSGEPHTFDPGLVPLYISGFTAQL